jgi:hypothetical protein
MTTADFIPSLDGGEGMMAVTGSTAEEILVATESPEGYHLRYFDTPGGVMNVYTFPCGCVYTFRHEGHWMWCSVARGEEDGQCSSFNPR